MLIFVCLLGDLILGFCYNNLTQETNGLELASTITLALQANRLTRCACHPNLLLPTNCLSVFDHFVGLLLKELIGNVKLNLTFIMLT